MGIFDKWRKNKNNDEEERALFDYNPYYSSGTIYSLFTPVTGITKNEAIKIPSVAACLELISGSIAQLPIYLYRENERGEVEKIHDDNRVFLLNSEPNEAMNGFNFKKKIISDYLFYGVSYIKKEMERNKITELYPLTMENVQVTKLIYDGYKYNAIIKLTYLATDRVTRKQKEFRPEELVMIVRDSDDGFTGRGILNDGAEIIRLALNEVEYSSNVLKNGALPIGVIETENKLHESVIKRLREGWETLYAGMKNAGKTVILENGLKYRPISLKPNDLQMVENKKVTISDIARLFNVPESMLNADANKYASNEQNNLHFLQYTLAPIISSIESALDKSLLLESEKEDGYYFRCDTSEILRTTEKEKIESAAEGLKNGIYSLNETRSKLDLHKLEDDYFMWSLGHVLFNPKTKEIFVPNMQGSGDLDDPVPKEQQEQPLKTQPADRSKTTVKK